MDEGKDYIKYPLRVTLLVILMMLGLSFVPPFSLGSVHFKRTNILSDILSFAGDSVKGEFDDSADRLFLEEMERREAEQIEAAMHSGTDVASVVPPQPREQSWDLSAQNPKTAPADNKPAYINGELVVKIEDYFDGAGVSIGDFCRLLGTVTGKRTVRIAFLGDSYIEGDIITADVRDRLQELYGGNGVGFVPFSTPLATHRPTIKQTYGGWTNYNLAQKKNAPEELTDKFFVSGTLSIPEEGAWTEYECTGYRKHSARSSAARLLFENPGRSSLKLTVNDTIERTFKPDAGETVQQIKIGGTTVKKLRVDVENPEGFIGYGVSFEGNTGIIVDNYSIRSNSGIALFGTSPNINSQMDRMLGYDLVVLQYGLNAMDPNVVNYAGYGENMRRVVRYIRRSFPNAAVLMLGVGDRSTLENGEFVTMPAVHAMLKVQRAVAKDCGVAYWDTFTAMGGENSMAGFVEKQWAAKDYTHLSFGGGRYIAKQLVNALLYVKQVVEEPDAGDDAEYLAGEAARSGGATQPTAHDLAKAAAQQAGEWRENTASAGSLPGNAVSHEGDTPLQIQQDTASELSSAATGSSQVSEEEAESEGANPEPALSIMNE